MKKGIFVFCYAQFVDGTSIHFSDVCYQQTIELCRPFLDDIIVISRLRHVSNEKDRRLKRIEDTGSRLGLELPDYGAGGQNGLKNLLRLFLSVEYSEALQRMFREADFIYVEGPSYESFLVSWIAQQVGQQIMLEMRGDATLNHNYMAQRFGLAGYGLALFNRALFVYTRNQALSGLYVSQLLKQQYPISGNHQQAISDIRLPEEIYRQARLYTQPLSRFLFVGYLERVKRIDLILLALYQIQHDLSEKWHFDIVGDGPEIKKLQQVTLQLAIQNHVSFHGRITWGSELFSFYEQADMLLMASTSEGTSRTMLEAMASGLPVISTDVGAARELLNKEALVKVGNIELYAQKLKQIATNYQLAMYLSEQNYIKAQSFYLSKIIELRTAFYKQSIMYSTNNKQKR